MHFAISALVGACGLAATTFAATSVPLAIASLTVATIGIAACMPVFWAIPGQILSKRAAAGGIALINTIGIAAGAVAPALVGAIKSSTGGFAASLWVLTAALVVAALLMLFAWRAPRSIAANDGAVANAA